MFELISGAAIKIIRMGCPDLVVLSVTYETSIFLPLDSGRDFMAKFPHSSILHYACRSLLTENNGKNNATVVGLCAVFVVFWWENKGLHTLNRIHNEVWGCAEI